MEPNFFAEIFRHLPGNYIILLPDSPKFTIVAFNLTREIETFTTQADIGKGIFEAFPDNPADPTANGVAMLTASLETVLKEKRTDRMPFQKYDIANQQGTAFEVRYWQPENIPLLHGAGEVAYIIHAVRDTTDLVQSKLREEQSRKDLQAFLDQSQSPFAILTGREFLFTYANPAYVELMNQRQLVGRTVTEAIPELKDQPFLKQLEEVYDKGTSYYGTEVPATAHFKGSPEDSTRYFNLSYTAMKDASGKTSGVLAYGEDVTDKVDMRKQVQLNELNEQAYNLFMQAPVAVCILKGNDHTVVLANDRVLTIWGRDRSVIGKPILESLPEIREQGIIELLDQVKNNRETFYANEHEVKLIRNGREELVYINFVYQPYYEKDRSVSGVIAIAMEVTEQVVARKKIEVAQETTRLAIESADLGVYDLHLETQELVTTPRFHAIWGIDGAASREAMAAAIHPGDQDLRKAAHAKSLETGKLSYEARVVWPNQTIHWVRITGTVLFSDGHIPYRLIGVVQDITSERAFTEEMQRLVAERTQALTAANVQLEKTNQELDQFAHVTSHDLQEPLRKIQLFSAILSEREDLDKSAQTHVSKIENSAKRMAGLIRDLLEYAKLSQKAVQYQAVDLNEIIRNVLSDFELLITQSGAYINVHPLITLPAVPLQMNQLFYNLVGNALKFAKPGEPPRVEITGETIFEHEPSIPGPLPVLPCYRIRVHDQGIGFEQTYAQKIFAVFQRLNQHRAAGGYGIGLALCQKVVENHGGVIYAESQPGEGAIFTILLPLRDVPEG